MKQTAKRETNIELLRIVLIFSIILCHISNPSVGGLLLRCEDNSSLKVVLYFVQSLSSCAVNLFIIISGYFLSKSTNRNAIKPLALFIQASMFSALSYLLNGVFESGFNSISTKGFIISFIPFNYFVTLYITLYFVSPFFSYGLGALKYTKAKQVLFMAFTFFSIIPTCVDLLSEVTGTQYNQLSPIGLYGSEYGYSIVNFILMFSIGTFLYKYIDKIKASTKLLLCVNLGIVILLTLWQFLCDKTGYFVEKSALEYCNPFVIIQAINWFIIFKRIKIHSGVINSIAKQVFPVFLLHKVFVMHLPYELILKNDTAVALLALFISAVMIFIICAAIGFLYGFIDKLVVKILSMMNIDRITFNINEQ